MEIQNITNNILGTVSFELKAKGHRGFQSFTVYPIGKNEKVEKVAIQSDKRFGYYFFETGKILLSKSQNYSNSVKFQMDKINNKITEITINAVDKVNLNLNIRITDENKGGRGIIIDNQGANQVKI